MNAAEPPKIQPPPQIQEFSIRVPKNSKKKHNVMRFNAVLKVDFKEWKQVKMERENNLKDFREMEEEIPKFGAGSEFGREAREEARRKKYGITSKKYKPDDQPWILKANGKTGKKFKGIREGGISANAAYYVFTHAPDGAIEAFPLHEWYNFQPIRRFKALSAEEAEQEFSRRNKVLNYFNLMTRKRLRNEEDDGEDGDLLDGEKKKKPSKKEKDFKISEMDEWMDSDDDDDSDSDEKEDKKKSEDEDDSQKKKKKDAKKKKKKKKNVSDDEAFEESDDGDEEGRECDYISDSSASESELESQKEIKSVAEEDALRKLLASDEEDEDEEQNDKKDEEDNENEEGKDEKEKDKSAKNGDKKKDKKKSKKKKEDGSDSSDDGSNSDQNKDKEDKKPNSSQSSRSATPTIAAAAGPSDSLKRTLNSSPDPVQAKKSRLEGIAPRKDNYSISLSSSYVPGSSESGITEDAVRRYLMRKPMTTTELLQKFKAKKTGLSSEQIVTIMTKILKNINPISQKIKGKMYFSIKALQNQPQPHK